MYYAIYCPYGRSTMSKCDTLYRFKRKADRDAMVNDEVFDGQNYHWAAITRDDARKYFPRAFNGYEFTCWITCAYRDEWAGAPTGGDYAYMS